jgi:SMC interacting uncharacterized protein involved in chromosome segregation
MSNDPISPEDKRYDPYSYDAVLSKIVTRLDAIHSKLDEFTEEHRENNNKLNKQILDVEASVNNRLDTLELKVNERMKDLEKRVVSLEYYKYYIAGMIAVFSAAAGYIFNKLYK